MNADPVYAAFGELERSPPDPSGTACDERGLAGDRDHLLLPLAAKMRFWTLEDLTNDSPPPRDCRYIRG
jgi:hypothetical protein